MTLTHDPVPSAPQAAAPGRARDAYFDNAKFLAIVLVVLGHTWGPLISNNSHLRELRGLYELVYSFHMPLFVLISGWFSRSFAAHASDPVRLRRLLGSTVVPYLIFVTAYELYNTYRHGETLAVNLLDPFYLTWFLVALFIWRLTAPLLAVMRAPVLVSVLVMLASGYTSLPATFDLVQVFQFLPFFVLGLTVRPEHVQRLRDSQSLRRAGAAVLVVALVAARWIPRSFSASWLYRDSGHRQLHVSMVHWVGYTLLMTVAGLVLSLAFLAVVPRRKVWITPLGSGTQYTYLLHGFVVQGALAVGFEYNHFDNTPAGQVVITACALLLAVLLATPPVRRLLHWAVEPELRWAFRAAEPSRT